MTKTAFKEPERCPHVIRKLAGDESYDICEINMKSCLIEHGLYECEIYDEWGKEVIDENK